MNYGIFNRREYSHKTLFLSGNLLFYVTVQLRKTSSLIYKELITTRRCIANINTESLKKKLFLLCHANFSSRNVASSFFFTAEGIHAP